MPEPRKARQIASNCAWVSDKASTRRGSKLPRESILSSPCRMISHAWAWSSAGLKGRGALESVFALLLPQQVEEPRIPAHQLPCLAQRLARQVVRRLAGLVVEQFGEGEAAGHVRGLPVRLGRDMHTRTG